MNANISIADEESILVSFFSLRGIWLGILWGSEKPTPRLHGQLQFLVKSIRDRVDALQETYFATSRLSSL